MSIGIAIRKEALAIHQNFTRAYERQRYSRFELKCELCDVSYVVYCEPGIRETSARQEFLERIWSEHPHHSEVTAVGGDAVA